MEARRRIVVARLTKWCGIGMGGHRLVRSAVEHHVLVSRSGVDACKRKGLLAKRCSALSGGARVARVGSFRLFVVISFAILDEPIIGSDALS